MARPTRITATQFQQAVGAFGDRARHGPVVVTRHRRPWLVVLDPDEYARLKAFDTRQARAPHELDAEIKAELRKGYQGRKTPDLDHLLD
ncbi:MAG: type II toxin-antitoxin system Phd/YefM family antitoxin [Rhodospirillaceae bacterium]|nr:type II toxin-antitoxin system Phd/YefM family antitoxin [Rhodospirillaceae bacterium]